MKRVTGSFAALVVGILTFAACGENEDRLSASEFGERNGAACAIAFEKGEAALPQNAPVELRLTADRVSDFAEAMENWATTVDGLAAPDSLEAAAERFHEELEALAGRFRRIADEGGSEEALLEALNRAFPGFQDLEALAKPLGLSPIHTCAGRVTPPAPDEADAGTP